MPANDIQEERLRLRGKVAALTRSRPADDPELIKTRQNLLSCSIRESARRYVEQAPPLTPEQADRLIVLLRDMIEVVR